MAISETAYELYIQKQVVEVNVPDLNGYKPERVRVTNMEQREYTYDNNTQILTITRQSTVNEETGEIKSLISRSNVSNVEVTYPIEAYTTMDSNTFVQDIYITGYNYCFNNPGIEFENPYVSTSMDVLSLKYMHLQGELWRLNAYAGERIYDSGNRETYKISKNEPINIYNGNVYENVEDKYNVQWQISIGKNENIKKITIQEPTEENTTKTDMFLNANGNYESMRDYISIDGLYFENVGSVLGKYGYINIYNSETGSLIETFTKANWNKYKKETPYKIKLQDLKSIKVETSNPIAIGSFDIFQIKKINDEELTKKYTKEEFDKIAYIYTYAQASIELDETSQEAENTSMSIAHYANYEVPCSIHKLNLDKIKITNQKTEDVTFSIDTFKSSNFEEEWKDGVFLIEFPKEIIALDINSISASNSNIAIRNYDVYKENDKYFIKIFTENEEKANFSILVDAEVTANPLETTKTVKINCFGYNPICDNYEFRRIDLYDIDNDENRNDFVGISSQDLTLIAPAGLISTEYVTEYDELNNTCIAPNIAEIQKSDEVKNARINISLTNSYSGTISEIMILGKIPFTGNKYTETNEELKSRFNTKLKSAINIPENIMQYVTVYYSEESNPNKDLQDASNGWILEENVSNWENIKSYLIDFGEYKLSRSENEIIYYDVEVPGGLDYNLTSFSNHAIYFCLDTPEGKLRTQIETNKVGLQIVEKYNMQITKNRKGFDNTKVGGAIYRVVCMDADNKPISKLATSNSEGILQFKDLYLNKEYTLKEISAPENYSVDKSEIKFIVYKDEQENMIFETINSRRSRK